MLKYYHMYHPCQYIIATWRSTYRLVHSEKRKGRKSQFLFMAQLFRKMNLADIFSGSRSGRIPHKNKKKLQQSPNAAAYNRPSVFFYADLSYVGFLLVSDLLDIKGDTKYFTFNARINRKILIHFWHEKCTAVIFHS